MKRTIGMAAAVAALGAGVWGTTAFAATPQGNQNRMSNLTNALATRFNLNQSDVQKFFDDQHANNEASRIANEKSQLNQAVTNGKITQAQEDLIIAKHTEIKTFMDSLKGKTNTEIEAAIKNQKASLKTWANSNNIPEQFIRFGMGGPGMRHRGGQPPTDGMRGGWKTSGAAPTAQ